MAYTPYDDVNPLDSQTGIQLPVTINANEDALWHGVVIGSVPGWTPSVVTGSGTAAKPQYRVWSNGALRLRATYTYTGNYVTSLLKEFSSNSGTTPNATGTWSTIATETATYDGSNNYTGGTNGGLLSWLYEWIGRIVDLTATVTSLASSLYNAAAVAITGGTISGVAVTASTVKGTPLGGTGATEAALATVLAVHTAVVALTPAGGGTATLDLAAADHFKITPAGNFTIALTNTPATGFSVSIILELVNCAGKTITLPSGGSWGAAGAPTFSSGTDYVNVISSNGFSTSRFVFGSKG